MHELPAAIEPTITKSKQVMTGNNKPSSRSPLQQSHRIVAEARRFSAIAELFIDGQGDDHWIYVLGQ